jgi:hypothetical protein
MYKLPKIISLLLFLYFCITHQIYYYKIAITIYFFNFAKIISNNNYRIATSFIADTLIYKNNLHIKKNNFRLWFNTVLSYINLYDEKEELKFYYYYYLFTICSNFYPNKLKNVIILLFVFIIYSLTPTSLSYINMILSLYNIFVEIYGYITAKNIKYSKLLFYLIDNIFYIEKFLIPKDNVFLYPIYYTVFLIYKHFQTKLR